MSESTITTPNVIMNQQPAKIVSVEQAPQLDLEEKSLDAPVYKWTKLTQVSGGTTQTLTTSTTLTQFNIPGNVVTNLSRSFLSFDVTMSEETKDKFSVMQCDSIPIDYIQLKSQSGDVIGEVRNAQRYTKVVRPAHTHISDYMSRGVAVPRTNSTASPQTTGFQTNWYLQPASNLTGDATATLVAGELNSKYIDEIANGTQSVSLSWTSTANAIIYSANGIDVPNAPQALYTNGVAAANPPVFGSRVICNVKIPLSAFSSTIMGIDKNLYFGQNMQIWINWQPLSGWGFGSTLAAGTLAQLTNVSFTNFYLYLCKDTNPKNIEYMMRQNQTTGVEMLVPWCDGSNRTSAAANTSFTYSTLISPGSGLAVKRVYTSVFDDTCVTGANPVNTLACKYTDLQSSVDSRYIQDAPIGVINNELYHYMWPQIKNSAAGLSALSFLVRPFFVDNFSDADGLVEANKNDTLYSGLSIGPVFRQYDVKFTQVAQGNQLTYYQWVVYLRKLRITPISIKFV